MPRGGKRPGAGRPRKPTSYKPDLPDFSSLDYEATNADGDRYNPNADAASRHQFNNPDRAKDLEIHPEEIINLVRDTFTGITSADIAREANRLMAKVPAEKMTGQFALTVIQAAALEQANKNLLGRIMRSATDAA